MPGRLAALLDVLRPRAIARTSKLVEDLTGAAHDLRRSVKQLEHRSLLAESRASALQGDVRLLQQAVAELTLRESRLRSIYHRDLEWRPALEAVEPVLDAEAIRAHVQRSFAQAPLHLAPFPHIVLEDLFPASFYDAVIDAIPPVDFFDGVENRQRIVVPFEMAPAFSRRVWGFLLNTVVEDIVGPAMLRTFDAPLREWLAATWPEIDRAWLETKVRMQSTDGRILLRGRGYTIPPHRDPKWGFVTCLLYLAKPGDSTAWGTQLYDVDGDVEAESVAPHWIRAESCRLVKDVPFRPNTALVFLNSSGAHGARIPARPARRSAA